MNLLLRVVIWVIHLLHRMSLYEGNILWFGLVVFMVVILVLVFRI